MQTNKTTKEERFKNQVDQLAESIISQMEEGANEWVMPWHVGIKVPVNHVTGRLYQGKNLLILWQKCIEKDYHLNRWATLKQWPKTRSFVKKGEEGTIICIAIPRYNKGDKRREGGTDRNLKGAPQKFRSEFLGFTFRYTHVFNISQVSNKDPDQIELFREKRTNIEQIDEMIRKCNVNLRFGPGGASYSYLEDIITMPHKASFNRTEYGSAEESYYTTLLHELVHWTGHKTRLNRFRICSFGSPVYAFEELVAELGCAILSVQFNQRIEPRTDHAPYLKHWLKVLKSDFDFFFRALDLAVSAVHWLYKTSGVLPYSIPEQHYTVANDELVKGWERLDV